MQQFITKCLGHDLNIQVASTVDEYNNLCPTRTKAGENPVVEDANTYTVFHVMLSKIRGLFIDKLVKESGIAQKTKEGNKPGTTVVNESDGAYYDRVLAETQTTEADWDHLMKAAVSEVSFNPDQVIRSSGPLVVAKIYHKTATALFSNPAKAQKIALTLASQFPDVKFPDGEVSDTGEFTPAGLARLISANEAKKRAETNLVEQYQ